MFTRISPSRAIIMTEIPIMSRVLWSEVSLEKPSRSEVRA